MDVDFAYERVVQCRLRRYGRRRFRSGLRNGWMMIRCRCVQDFFDQSLDEIKILKYLNAHDTRDDHHLLQLYDYFYFKVLLLWIASIWMWSMRQRATSQNCRAGEEIILILSRSTFLL